LLGWGGLWGGGGVCRGGGGGGGGAGGGELRNVCRALLFWCFRTVIVLDFKVVNSLKNTEDASIFKVFPRFTERTVPRVFRI